MRILFAGGDVGGCRALLPVCAACEENGADFLVYDHGHLVTEIPPAWAGRRVHEDADGVEPFLAKKDVGVLVFSSSVHDHTALGLARKAQAQGIPVVHVLDHWSGYAARMAGDGGEMFRPDCYAVPDELARTQAVADGIDPGVLLVSGQPALGDAVQAYQRGQREDRAAALHRHGLDPRKKVVLFVSEPAAKDQGVDASNPLFRGYTELDALELFVDSLENHAEVLQVGVLPHPREDAGEVEANWNRLKGRLTGAVLRLDKGRDALPLACGVAGMASILLYEAWLVGLPVVSIQPGVRHHSLRMLQVREGLDFIDSKSYCMEILEGWVSRAASCNESRPVSDAVLHENAAENLYEVVMGYLDKMTMRSHARRT